MKAYFLILLLLFCPRLCAQFYEDFENTTGPDALPSTNWTLGSGNWAVFDNGVGLEKRWEITNLTTTPPVVYSGLNSAYMSRENIGVGATSIDYLATPLVTIPAEGKLRFYTRSFMIGNQGTIFQIKVSPASNLQTNASGYELVQEFTDGNLTTNFSTFEEKIVDLSLYAGQQVYIAFVRIHTQLSHNVGDFGDRWIIDNLSITSGFDCNFSNNCQQSLELIPFLDTNLNGIKDLDEPIFNLGHFTYNINNSVDIHSYNNSGPFTIHVNSESDIYNLSFIINSSLAPFYTSTSINDVTVLAGSGVNTYYFPVINPNPIKNVEINLTPISSPSLSYNLILSVEYKNLGTEIVSGETVSFTEDVNLDNLMYYTIGTPLDIIYSTNSFTYPVINLAPLETRSSKFFFDIPDNTSLQLGDLITNSVDLPVINDIDNSNNHSSLTQTILASLDPNNILESHGEKITFDNFTTNEYLTYTIMFENIGNADAEFVRIENTLNNQLDESTFELVTSSHDVNVTRNANQLTFRYFNINLPPSIPNSDVGHGFVKYKIKPKPGYAIGDIIPNTAEIYFDYNPAIVTNTFNTEFVQSLSNVDFNENSISLNPNPAKDYFTINNIGNEKISGITIYEISGKKVFETKKSFENQINIDVSNFARGIYLVEIVSENKSKLTKKLILK
ncbi:T9SS type A sorting domain-containing protein [Flavobacterium sp.]|uniref:DUF7619 domain-containing protein n=1 Tax=Flavobacterium sp. TaxID=239 RepID=UPI0035B2FFC2